MDATLADKAREILRSLQDDASLVPESIREWWGEYLTYHHERYLITLAYLGQPGTKVLEIGSAPGHFTALMTRMGYEVTGVDLDPDRLRDFWDRYSLEVHRADIETDRLPVPASSFDTVLFTEVVEHLRINPLHAFRELSRVMKPTGRMIVSTPNITPSHRLLFLLGRNYQGNLAHEYKKLETLGHMGHVRLYSYQDVQDFLDEVGGLEIEAYNLEGSYVKGSWRTTLLRMLCPVKKYFRSQAYFVVRKGPQEQDRTA